VLDCRRPTPRRKTSRIESIAFRLRYRPRASRRRDDGICQARDGRQRQDFWAATIVGAHAGELIAEFALAIGKGLHAKDIS